MSREKERLERLAEIIATSIDWDQARLIDANFPGFLAEYEAAQDQWERDPANRTTHGANGPVTHPPSKRVRKS